MLRKVLPEFGAKLDIVALERADVGTLELPCGALAGQHLVGVETVGPEPAEAAAVALDLRLFDHWKAQLRNTARC